MIYYNSIEGTNELDNEKGNERALSFSITPIDLVN